MNTDYLREQIKKQTEEYLKKVGKITELPSCQFSQNGKKAAVGLMQVITG